MGLCKKDRQLVRSALRGDRLTKGERRYVARLCARAAADKARPRAGVAPIGSGLAFNGTVGCNGGL